MNPFDSVDIFVPEKNQSGRKLSEREIQSLLSAPNPRDPSGIRDIALLTLLAFYGLEVWQLQQLDVNNINEESDAIHLYTRREKPWNLFVDETSMTKISKWLRTRNLYRTDTNAVFISMHWTAGRGEPGKRLSRRGIRLIVDKYLEQVDIINMV